MLEKRRRLMIGLGAALVVLGGAAVGVRALRPGPQATSVANPAAATLQPETEITFVVPEPSGRVDETTETAKALGVDGRRVQSLAQTAPGWSVQMAKGGVRLTPQVHARPLYLGTENGQISIFFGPPALGWLDEMTGVQVAHLQPADRARLKQGVAVTNLAEAWQLMQGLGG